MSQSAWSGIEPPQVWIRWLPLWHLAAYLSIIGSATFGIFTAPTWQLRVLNIAGALLLALWYSICVRVDPHWWRKHAAATCAYLLSGWALWLACLQLGAAVFPILFALFLQVFLFPAQPWKLLLALGLIALAAYLVFQAYGIGTSLFLFIGVTLMTTLIALFVDAVIAQNYVQRNLIRELAETRQELAVAERQAGVVEERQRLAYEIHDTLAQGLTSIVMHLEAADIALAERGGLVQQRIDRARRIARENLDEAHRLMWALQPVALERASLGEVLHTLVAQWALEHGIAAEAIISGTSRALRPACEHALLRAVQEALTNARKHARASRITVTLSYMEDLVMLDIEDNGVGFTQSEQKSASHLLEHHGGLGLKGLRERVEKLGGTLTIESAPGEGAIVTVALPEVQGKELV